MSDVPNRLLLDLQTALAGRYSLERELGRGGMGVVYLAREVSLDRLVALKLLPPRLARDPVLRERFLGEARTAAKLSHPHIVPIHTVDQVGDFVFFAMAFVDGETLTQRVRSRGPLTASDAARVLREVAWALAYAHAGGVVHRDVKPDNIVLEAGSGRTLVTDFGIAARVTDAAARAGGDVAGTPEFMSPEQALGEGVDARSDLYALGVTAYFTLTGRLPFEGPTAAAVLARQVGEPAPSLARGPTPVPGRLAALVDRCLAKDPAQRPATAADVADRLAQTLDLRREPAVPIRVFVRRAATLNPVLTVVSVWLAGGAATAVARAAHGPFAGLAFAATLVLGSLAVPVATLINRARRVLKAGFTRDDALQALRADVERAREERSFEFGMAPVASPYERTMRAVAIGGLAGGAALAALGSGVGAAAGFLAGGAGLALWLARLSQRRDVSKELSYVVWKGRLGRWLFARAAMGLPRGGSLGQVALTHRPTEMALSLAAEELYEALPREVKSRFGDVPKVVRHLEADARRMRDRLATLRDALGDDVPAGDGSTLDRRRDAVRAELEAERAAVESRLHAAVAALETLRLGLLRLQAGTGDVGNVTTDLGLAREVAADVDRFLEARKELDEA